MPHIISGKAVKRRAYWVEEIRKVSGKFGDDSDKIEKELAEEVRHEGIDCLIDHLRLCGDIPESYGHDSSEEKLYSKYTDALLSEAFKSLGLKSLVLKERADAADVEVFASGYSFVADAKAFRLSRTAKNQKDFKVQAMDGWKRGKNFAMVVCPIYQLPTRASQIYQQASARNVCLLSYSHLAVLCTYAKNKKPRAIEDFLEQVFLAVKALVPSKDALMYWSSVNRVFLAFDKQIAELWALEKAASLEAIDAAKELALTFLAGERERIVRMNHADAIKELLAMSRVESKMKTIQSVCDSGILGIS